MPTFLPSDFMERIVDWPGPDGPGYINAHWQAPEGRGGGMRGRPFKTLHDFMDFVQYAAAKPGTYKEIFFCLSKQAMVGRAIHGHNVAHRHATKALAVKALWLDVDVKPEKGYASISEALDAIQSFRSEAGLPPPSALVFSGGGVHVYWISDKPLTAAVWKPYADGLKAEAIRLGLKCDAGITADVARVLRVPGTFNNKLSTPRPVRLAHLGDSYDFAATPEIARLATIVTVAVTSHAVAAQQRPQFNLTGWAPPPAGQPDPSEILGAGCVSHSDLPLVATEVFRNCVHYRDSLRKGGKGQSQGLWMQTVLGATWFENGRQIAHALSDKYPTYTREETDAMFDRKVKDRAEKDLGWPACKTFEGEGAKCSTCPFFNKLRSPLNLAERSAPLPPPPTHLPSAEEEELDLPEGYALGPNGWISEMVTKTISNGVTADEYVPLFMCRLRNFQAISGDERAIRFETSLDGQRWGKVEIVEGKHLINEQTCITALRQQHVKPFPDHQKRIVQFMTSFTAKLDAAKSRERVTAFGWLYPTGQDGHEETHKPIGFAYGGKVFMADGTEHAGGFMDAEIEKGFKPVGTEDPWWALHNVITNQKHAALEVIALSGFAAPLMAFAHQYNGVFCAWSPESGAHKSTSIALGLSVWAKPQLAKDRSVSTGKGIIKKLGVLHNLPVYWDEINNPRKLDDIAAIVGDLSEGGGGARLKSNRDFHQIETWQTLMLVGSNQSLAGAVLKKERNTDAALQRIFEYVVDKRPDTLNRYDVDKMVDALNYNYGQIGLRYAKMLGSDPIAHQQLVDRIMAKFDKAVGTSPVTTVQSEERMRAAMAVTIYCGGILANSLGCAFNLDEVWAFLVAKFIEQRDNIHSSQVVAGTPGNTANTVTQFMKSMTKNTLWIAGLPAYRPGRPGAIVWLGGVNKENRDAVHVRFSTGDRCVQISKEKLIEWLSAPGREIPWRSLQNSLAKNFGAVEIQKVSLNAGIGVGGGRETIINIPIKNSKSPWWDDLWQYTPSTERPDGEAEAEPVTAAVTTGLSQAKADLDLVRRMT